MAEKSSKTTSRSFALGFFLVLWLLGSGLSALHYLFGGSDLSLSQPDLPWWGLPVLIILTLVQFFSYWFIWKWQRWAVYGALGSTTILFFFKLIFFDSQPPVWSPAIQFFINSADAMSGLLGSILFALWLLIFGLLMRANWQNFK